MQFSMVKIRCQTMRISARNKIQGEIVSVETDKLTAVVKVRINVPTTLTSTISREAVEDLDIQQGDKVIVIVEASSVMIGKEE